MSIDGHPLEARANTDGLVLAGLAGGSGTHAKSWTVEPLAGGNTALGVSRVTVTSSMILKEHVDPALVDEARLLQRIKTDPALPDVTRDAFPEVYEIDDVGPVYAYLMEDLSDCTALRDTLSSESPVVVAELIRALWVGLLEPTYRATRMTRLLPNPDEDYVLRARDRLVQAAGAGLVPSPDRAITLRYDGQELRLGGWEAGLGRAARLLPLVRPNYSTFVHGDPNPENLLWRHAGPAGLQFRMIDPKAWFHGDYVFDLAKLCHYLRVTHPVEHHGLRADVHHGEAETVIEYSRALLPDPPAAERLLLEEVTAFATDPRIPDATGWELRFELAVAANLLGIVGPRLARAAAQGDRRHADLAWIALAEGLRLLYRPHRV